MARHGERVLLSIAPLGDALALEWGRGRAFAIMWSASQANSNLSRTRTSLASGGEDRSPWTCPSRSAACGRDRSIGPTTTSAGARHPVRRSGTPTSKPHARWVNGATWRTLVRASVHTQMSDRLNAALKRTISHCEACGGGALLRSTVETALPPQALANKKPPNNNASPAKA